jgi:hypothetical protein
MVEKYITNFHITMWKILFFNYQKFSIQSTPPLLVLPSSNKLLKMPLLVHFTNSLAPGQRY